MKKKALLVLLGVAFALLVFGCVCIYESNKIETETVVETVLSDEELVNRYVEVRFGSEYYGVLDTDNTGDIGFWIYSLDDSEEYYCQCSRLTLEHSVK